MQALKIKNIVNGSAEEPAPGAEYVDVLVEFAHIPGGPVMFTARADDVEAHGREIFARVKAGEAGAVKLAAAKG